MTDPAQQAAERAVEAQVAYLKLHFPICFTPDEGNLAEMRRFAEEAIRAAYAELEAELTRLRGVVQAQSRGLAQDDKEFERQQEREQAVARLVEAVKKLFAVRAETELTYEEAYHFTFKSGAGRNAWNELNAARRAIEQAAGEETRP